MEYRIYVDYLKGYKCLGTHNPKRTIKILDSLMNDNTFKLISVVECDKEHNSEFPAFVYTGFNDEDYIDFKKNLVETYDIKRYIKKFDN